MPSLRIDQSDLKCKNGCDYYGNPSWQGYCSKCHRELLHRQKRAEKAEKAGTLPKPDQKKPERGLKLTSHSSFSKFEEKRLRQSETSKKANLLKFTVFKKSNTEEQEQPTERRPPQFKVPAQVHEGMKTDFRARFPRLPAAVERDARALAQKFITDVIAHHNLPVDELSDRVQRQYQLYMKHMESSPNYANVDAETRENLVDFVERHAMSYLHDLPSIVFSPCGTEDERLDRAMSERIQQLGWVGERQLECRLDRGSAQCRQLLYKAINELLGMDSAPSPGGKLQRVRRACRHVLALCGGGGAPASADDLLPALIFTVLKANPPRLVSNINFVTRFCNAQRLMTGEGGYYFTNLCCAVSFIENLSAESLSMDKKEFDCYMSMPASIGGSAWAAALSLCGAAREADEMRARADQLHGDIGQLRESADRLAAHAETFEQEISKKVQDVLAKTPLVIQPRREPPRLAPPRPGAPLVDLASPPPTPLDLASPPPTPLDLARPPTTTLVDLAVPPQTALADLASQAPANLVDLANPPSSDSEQDDTPQMTAVPEIKAAEDPVREREPRDVYHFETPNPSPSKSPLLDQPWSKQASSLELLTPSPLGFAPFDRSIDELLTPDEFVPSLDLAPGLGNINYDIDLSDFSGDNSLADDAPKTETKDQFGDAKFDPFAPRPSRAAYSAILEQFDEFSLNDSSADTFEVVHRDHFEQPRDPFSPIQDRDSSQDKLTRDPFSPDVQGPADPFSHVKGPTDPFSPDVKGPTDPFSPDVKGPTDPFSPDVKGPTDPFSPVHKESTSILDDSSSSTAACLLPSPLQPHTNKSS